MQNPLVDTQLFSMTDIISIATANKRHRESVQGTMMGMRIWEIWRTMTNKPGWKMRRRTTTKMQ